MKVRIEIDTKTFVRFWLVMIGFALAFVAVYSARSALIIIGISLFLALALNAPVTRLTRWLPDRSRVLSTAIAFLVVIGVLASVIFLVLPPIIQQSLKFVDSVPSLVQSMSTQWAAFGNVVDKYHLQPQIDQAVESAKDGSLQFAADFGKNVLVSVSSILSFSAGTILVLVLTFLMLIEGPMWLNRIWGVYRDDKRREHHHALAHKMYTVVSGYVNGQLTVSGIDGLAAGLTVFILSLFFPEIPSNLALPVVAIAFTLSLIPMFGATIAGAIITLLLLLNSLPAAIIFAIYFVVYQQIENNFISPTIQAKRIELSPLAVLIAVTIGLYVFGVLGGIISIPIAGCVKVLVEDYLQRRKKEHDDDAKPLAKLAKKLTGEEA